MKPRRAWLATATKLPAMTDSEPLQILALCGSLRARSSNLALLQAAQALAPPSLDIEIYARLGELPHFNPDLDGDALPASVADFRARLGACAGALICTPEYGHGLPGSFKNALDWTIASGEWMEKPTLILKAARSHHAHDSLLEILTTLMAKVSTRAVALPGNTLDSAALRSDATIADALRAALQEFAAQIAGT